MRLDVYNRPALFFGAVFLGFFALSMLVAVGPAVEVQDRYQPLPGTKPLSDAERRGLEVFVSEGCPVCHTQQVRPLPMDSVWGRPTVASDYARLHPMTWWQQTPGLLGSERTGPDLSNIGKRQPSEAWQLIHLYNPRAVSPWSIMPRFHDLFRTVDTPGDKATVVPVPAKFAPSRGKVVTTPRALDLVAYLLSLHQTPVATRPASAKATVQQRRTGRRALRGELRRLSPVQRRRRRGTFPPLKGDSVVNAADPTQHISTVLHGARTA